MHCYNVFNNVAVISTCHGYVDVSATVFSVAASQACNRLLTELTQLWSTASFRLKLKDSSVPPAWLMEQSTALFNFVMHHRSNKCHSYSSKQARSNSCPFGELEETTRTPSHYVTKDYPTGPEIQQPLPGWSNWRGSESSTLETDVCVWCYTLLVVLVRKRRRRKRRIMGDRERDI